MAELVEGSGLLNLRTFKVPWVRIPSLPKKKSYRLDNIMVVYWVANPSMRVQVPLQPKKIKKERVAQLVERWSSKSQVEGSSPFLLEKIYISDSLIGRAWSC